MEGEMQRETIQKITTSDESYKKMVEGMRSKPEAEVFGKNILNEITISDNGHIRIADPLKFQGLMNGYRRTLAHLFRRQGRSKIINLYNNSAVFVSSTLPTVVENEEDAKLYKKWGKSNPSPVERMYDPNVISDRTLAKIFLHHIALFEKRAEQFQSEEPSYREQFFKAIQASEHIPDHVKSSVRQRLDDVQVKLEDPLQAAVYQEHGSYSSDRNRILVVDRPTEFEIQSTEFHELMHALSGRTIVLRQPKDSISHESDSESTVISNQRLGLWTAEYDSERRAYKYDNFGWLNEAVTEKLIVALLENEPTSQSEVEIELLDLLQANGTFSLPFELFVNAYFEDYDPTRPPGERIPEWKKLYRAMNEAYAPGFLTRLDVYISANGVDAAITQLEKDWRVIMETETASRRKTNTIKKRS